MTNREIDALVALHVTKTINQHYYDGFIQQIDDRDGFIEYHEMENPVSPYSTNIADAWQVVEKMRSRSYQVSVGTVERYIDKYYCGLRPFMDDDTEYMYAPTAPMAICLAALRACGIEVVEIE